MGDYPHVLTPALFSGLETDPRVPLNTQAMEYMRNARSVQGIGAVFPERISAPDEQSISFPYPYFARLERGDLRLGATTVARRDGRSGVFSNVVTYDARDVATSVSVDEGRAWQFCSAHSVWFATNTENLIFRIPSFDGKTLRSKYTVNTIAMQGRRLLVAGVDDPDGFFQGSRWQHVMETMRAHRPTWRFTHEDMVWDRSWVVALEPGGGANDVPFHVGLAALGVFGDAEFDRWQPFIDTFIENGYIEIIPTAVSDVVYQVAPRGDTGVIGVYGDAGLTDLIPQDGRYREEIRSKVGHLPASDAVDGGGRQVAVDAAGFLVVSTSTEVKRLNYAQYLMTESEVVAISYDEVWDEFWITNGEASYVYNGQLSGPIDICPSSLVRDTTLGLVGYAGGNDLEAYDVELRFAPTNHGVQDWSRTVGALIEANGLTELEMRVDVRQSSSQDWIEGDWRPFYINNFCQYAASGVESRYSIRGSATKASLFRVSALEVRYQGSASNVRRGPAPRSS